MLLFLAFIISHCWQGLIYQTDHVVYYNSASVTAVTSMHILIRSIDASQFCHSTILSNINETFVFGKAGVNAKWNANRKYPVTDTEKNDTALAHNHEIYKSDIWSDKI